MEHRASIHPAGSSGQRAVREPFLPDDTTGLLQAWRAGEAAAAEQLLPRVYGELRRVAARQLRAERPDHTLDPSDLVHEAYLRLFGGADIPWQDRVHFFAVAANMMRRLLVDHARKRQRHKRGAGTVHVALERAAEVADPRQPDLLALDDALHDLAAFDPQKATIVELHFFGGLSVAETAAVVGCSTATVTRHWRMAKAWLFHALRDAEPP